MFQVLFVTDYYISIDGLDGFEDAHIINNENNYHKIEIMRNSYIVVVQ